MVSVRMNRARALLICTRPQNYTPARVHEAVAYPEKSEATEDERRLASEAMAWLQRKQDKPQAGSMNAAVKQKRKGT
jgi:hypothetical protein